MLEAAAINGLDLVFPDQDEVSDQIEALAARELTEEAFCEWLRALVPLDEG